MGHGLTKAAMWTASTRSSTLKATAYRLKISRSLIPFFSGCFILGAKLFVMQASTRMQRQVPSSVICLFQPRGYRVLRNGFGWAKSKLGLRACLSRIRPTALCLDCLRTCWRKHLGLAVRRIAWMRRVHRHSTQSNWRVMNYKTAKLM